MKVLFVIDHLGSGGAQRQLIELGRGLVRRGHQVGMFTYHPTYEFFKPSAEAAGIQLHSFRKRGRYSVRVVAALAGVMKQHGYQIVLSYLKTPSVYAELCRLTLPTAKIVVSERSSYLAERSRMRALIRTRMHALAHHVVTNSIDQWKWVEAHAPWLRGKASVIHNGIDIERFSADPLIPSDRKSLRLLAIGRVVPEKNIAGLIEALRLFEIEHGWTPRVTWVGQPDQRFPALPATLQDMLDVAPAVNAGWTWAGECDEIPDLIRSHHALIHPSLFEGFPNVICEALAASRPVLASDVCDNPVLVPEGDRGFLFDPQSPGSIRDAIGRLVALDDRGWTRIAVNAGSYAQNELASDRMVAQYEALFAELIA